jgi:hypothetical protein
MVFDCGTAQRLVLLPAGKIGCLMDQDIIRVVETAHSSLSVSLMKDGNWHRVSSPKWRAAAFFLPYKRTDRLRLVLPRQRAEDLQLDGFVDGNYWFGRPSADYVISRENTNEQGPAVDAFRRLARAT